MKYLTILISIILIALCTYGVIHVTSDIGKSVCFALDVYLIFILKFRIDNFGD
jgi:hypothetical protein